MKTEESIKKGRGENLKFLESTANESITYQNFRDTGKAVLRGEAGSKAPLEHG